jgi:DNA polymerase III alpha subunit
MKIDTYGQPIYNEQELFDLYMQDPDLKITSAFVEKQITIDPSLDLTHIPTLKEYEELSLSVDQFDEMMQSNWFMPDSYKSFDIAKWVLEQCSNEAELQRAGEELLMYQERGLFTMLCYLKYLVDVMRQYNIVWGVGRGSSVASFVLYLTGVHRINSLYYDLSIHEFLK